MESADKATVTARTDKLTDPSLGDDDPTPAQAESVEGLALDEHGVEFEVVHEQRIIKILKVA